MRIKYNAPVVLTYTFMCVIVLILNQFFSPQLIEQWFAVPGRANWSPTSVRNWINIVTHVIGHADWVHLIGNFTLILLIGPILEKEYGSFDMIVMIIITAAITGLLNVFLFSTGLYGASGIAFMMILLISFTNVEIGEIPITFILILIMYIGNEIYNVITSTDNISQFAHIVGGLCGSIFGFLQRVPLAAKKKTIENKPL
ncbi:hypothetical protein PilKf_00792 [Pillotina sp. SPG140]|jgi:membrane associated rhomboid family serine protease